MPDGDKIHAHLSQRYQKVYHQVCEGYFSDEELSFEVSRPLVKDIQQYRDVPIDLIEQVVTQLEQMPIGPLFENSKHWAQMSQEIDKAAQERAYDCSRRGLDLAVNSCKEKLLDLRRAGSSHDLYQEIIHNYVRNIYMANFEERVPLSQQHYGNVSQATIDERLTSMRPHVEERIAVISRRLPQKGAVASLIPPSSRRGKLSVDMYDNLLPD